MTFDDILIFFGGVENFDPPLIVSTEYGKTTINTICIQRNLLPPTSNFEKVCVA